MSSSVWLTSMLVLLCITFGCSGRPGRISPPAVDADEAAAAAFEQYDGNKDGTLNKEELAACPALVSAMPAYDTDKNGELAAAELAAGIRGWSEGQTGAVSLPFHVTLDGRSLGGAEVKAIPLPCLGDAVKPAAATANRGGAGFLGMSAEDRPANVPANVPLMQPGLYRVEITHPAVEVPAKYNVESTLGLEAALAAQNPSGVNWELTSQ